jgi:Domain of unknown function (DUF4331)
MVNRPRTHAPNPQSWLAQTWLRIAQSLPKPSLRSKRTWAIAPIALGIAFSAWGLAAVLNPTPIVASDHDDGDVDVRSRALSLTDLYAFREQDQNPSARADDLILVMNTNPRSIARQQYFFSTGARYEFKIARVAYNDQVPTGVPDMTLQFTFSRPVNGRQTMTLTVLERGKRPTTITRTVQGGAIATTPIASQNQPALNQISLKGSPVTIFSGLREDPFFFDVEQFFRVRAGALGTGPAVGFRTPSTALDFAKGYNVNTIALRVPRSLLQAGTSATTFDTWLTISIPDPRTGQFVQMEQMARPGINEALLVSQKNLANYNRIQPTLKPSNRLQAVAIEAKQTLLALGNTDAQANAILGAFLPDVTRIDTTAPSGFAKAFNASGSPIRGRLLKDDVIDVALSVLTQNAVTTDNVSYEGTPGNPAQGHAPLAPSFPYLALPN